MIATGIAVFVLLILSALFSGSETALTAASRPLMHELEKDGTARAATVNRLLDKRERLIGTILLGNNLVNILASALATSLLIGLFGEAGVVYATAGMTVLVLIFGEILPKTLALTYTTGMALWVAPILRVLVWLFAPVTIVLQFIVQVTLSAFQKNGASGTETAALMLAELRGVIDLHTRAMADASDEVRHERAMLRSVLDLGDVEVGEIMVHRRNVVSICIDQPVDDVVQQVLNSPYTRLPLWRDRPDNIVGVLHAKALLRAVHGLDALDALDIAEVASSPWFVPDATRLLDQLQAFRHRREHFALVVDEYGSLQGVVTLEDILEEIVGEISDEHDVAVSGVRQQPDGSYIINGDVTIRDLNREFDWNLPDDEASTVAGLVLHESRSIPDVGQSFLFHGFRFEIIRRQRNQITALRVAPQAADDTSRA
jgi:Mg2+/Co2+ transporter CorB